MSAALPFALVAMIVPLAAKAELVIEGLDDVQKANVLALAPLESTRCDAPRWRVRRLFRNADTKVAEALQALGFYEPQISKSLSWEEECWIARFDVQPGEPVRLRTVEISIDSDAATDDAFSSYLRAPRPVQGDILHHGHYSGFKNDLLAAAMHAGYFDADFDVSEIVVDRSARAADLTIRFHSGPKYRFEQPVFTGGLLRDELLAAFTDIEQDDLYSAAAIDDTYAALTASGYFSSVSIETDPPDTTRKTVPVRIDLVPSKRRAYSIGAGFTTDTGAHGRLAFTDRRRNRRGHRLESMLFMSAVREELTAGYRWPRRDPRREWYSIVGGLQHENTDTSRHDTFKLGLVKTRKVGASWLATRYVDFAREDFTVADEKSSSRLVIVGSTWESSQGRSLGRTIKGHRYSLDVRGASDSLGSDTSFLQFRGNARWVHGLGNSTRLLTRIKVGTTMKDKLSELPASLRFFAGGDHSVRGYGFETLGPTDDTGEVTGGSHLAIANIEVDRQIRPKWALAAFVDAGSAFNDTDIDVSTGVGVGVRWYSPVGPLRFDLAHPLDDPDRSLRIHISFGPEL